jgi:hypothetical protein
MNGRNDSIALGSVKWIRLNGFWIRVEVFAGFAEHIGMEHMAFFTYEGKTWGAEWSEFYDEKPAIQEEKQCAF